MMKFLQAIRAFFREYQDITEHARTGRRPVRPPQTAGSPGKR